jgi:hypothetical protein
LIAKGKATTALENHVKCNKPDSAQHFISRNIIFRITTYPTSSRKKRAFPTNIVEPIVSPAIKCSQFNRLCAALMEF